MNFLGCSAKYIWLLIRHGTRNPKEDIILEMKTRGVEIQKNIISEAGLGMPREPKAIVNEVVNTA